MSSSTLSNGGSNVIVSSGATWIIVSGGTQLGGAAPDGMRALIWLVAR